MLLAVWKNARWNPRETGTGEKSLARRVQREDFRQETGNDSVNRGILGRGCCSSLKRNFTFRAILRSFEFYCLSFKASMNQNFYTFFFFLRGLISISSLDIKKLFRVFRTKKKKLYRSRFESFRSLKIRILIVLLLFLTILSNNLTRSL